jgi:hypothetical protein
LCIDGTVEDSSSAAAAIAAGKCTAGVIASERVSVVLKGTLRFPDEGMQLVVGGGNTTFTVRRKLTWLYDTVLQTFSADVVITGEVTVTPWPTSLTGPNQQLAVVLAARVRLETKAYPGPGFTGPYTWSAARMALRPDPYDVFGMYNRTAPVTRRRLLQDSTGLGQGSQDVQQQHCDSSSSSGGADQPHTAPQSALADRQQQEADPARTCDVDAADTLAQQQQQQQQRRALQQAATSISSTSGSSITGTVEAKESGAVAPSVLVDTRRGDNRSWVDANGEIAIVGQVRRAQGQAGARWW